LKKLFEAIFPLIF